MNTHSDTMHRLLSRLNVLCIISIVGYLGSCTPTYREVPTITDEDAGLAISVQTECRQRLINDAREVYTPSQLEEHYTHCYMAAGRNPLKTALRERGIASALDICSRYRFAALSIRAMSDMDTDGTDAVDDSVYDRQLVMLGVAADTDLCYKGAELVAERLRRRKGQCLSRIARAAAVNGRLSLVRELIADGLPVDLFLAVAVGREDVARILLGKMGSGVPTDADGNTVLHYAMASGNPAIVDWSIASGAPLDAINKRGQTALAIGAALGRYDSINAIASRKSMKLTTRHGADHPIHLAAENGHNAVVDLLLNMSSSVDMPDTKGRTPLHRAAAAGRGNVVRLLLKHGANAKAVVPVQPSTGGPGRYVSGWNALHFGAVGGNGDVIDVLVAAGVDVNGFTSPDRNTGMPKETPLMVAIVDCQYETAARLLQYSNMDIDGLDAIAKRRRSQLEYLQSTEGSTQWVRELIAALQRIEALLKK